MARIVRKKQKIFAGDAVNNGVFGSLQAGVPQTTDDIETIQSLNAYNEGWDSATLTSEELPPLEEFQGLQYMQTSQLAYLFQEGVAEWNIDTTYYEGSMVKVINGVDYAIYHAIAETTGENPTLSTSPWSLLYNTADGIQSLTNLVQDLSNPTNYTYPSTQAIVNALAQIDISGKADLDLSNVNATGKLNSINWFMVDWSTGVIVGNAANYPDYTLTKDSIIVTECAPPNYYSHYNATVPTGQEIQVTCSASQTGYNSTIRYFPKGTIIKYSVSQGTWAIYAYSLNGG